MSKRQIESLCELAAKYRNIKAISVGYDDQVHVEFFEICGTSTVPEYRPAVRAQPKPKTRREILQEIKRPKVNDDEPDETGD